jgi:hypothetical protein
MPNQAPVQFGLKSDEVPQRFFQQMIYPFRRNTAQPSDSATALSA